MSKRLFDRKWYNKFSINWAKGMAVGNPSVGQTKRWPSVSQGEVKRLSKQEEWCTSERERGVQEKEVQRGTREVQEGYKRGTGEVGCPSCPRGRRERYATAKSLLLGLVGRAAKKRTGIGDFKGGGGGSKNGRSLRQDRCSPHMHYAPLQRLSWSPDVASFIRSSPWWCHITAVSQWKRISPCEYLKLFEPLLSRFRLSKGIFVEKLPNTSTSPGGRHWGKKGAMLHDKFGMCTHCPSWDIDVIITIIVQINNSEHSELQNSIKDVCISLTIAQRYKTQLWTIAHISDDCLELWKPIMQNITICCTANWECAHTLGLWRIELIICDKISQIKHHDLSHDHVHWALQFKSGHG